MTEILLYVFIYLIAAVIAVPIANRFGLGSALGYLIAGVVIGPVLGLVGSETETLKHFAEFGVVMMLFLVGLELAPRMLWQMRSRLLGLGGLQVGITSALITGIAILYGQQWTVALAIGLIFALSSTAIVLQTFNEKGLGRTEGGRAAFSVLLFQDIAVIPMLALIPLLALPELQQLAASGGADNHGISLVEHLPAWANALAVATAIAAVVFGGHYLTRPLFRMIAATKLREIFTATALMLVIGISVLMSLVGLSPALGTFLAGVVLATSEFRHELEANIEPFKGLLLGLFFITVGAGIDFNVLFADFGWIMGFTAGVITIKAVVMFGISLLFKIRLADRWLFSLSLAQAGEFGFVLISFSALNGVLPPDIVPTLSLVVALSMLHTPLLFILYDKVILPRLSQSTAPEPDNIEEPGDVIIAGMGRYGQVLSRLLMANDIQPVVLDLSPTQVEAMRLVHVTAYYGDATRPDLLHSAGIESASLLIVAIDDRERSVELVHYIKHQYPQVRVLARAFDRGHYYKLRSAGADFISRETFESSLAMGRQALIELGMHPFAAEQKARKLRQHEESMLDELYGHWLNDNDFFSNTEYRASYIAMVQEAGAHMDRARHKGHDATDSAWTPPPKHFSDDLRASARYAAEQESKNDLRDKPTKIKD